MARPRVARIRRQRHRLFQFAPTSSEQYRTGVVAPKPRSVLGTVLRRQRHRRVHQERRLLLAGCGEPFAWLPQPVRQELHSTPLLNLVKLARRIAVDVECQIVGSASCAWQPCLILPVRFFRVRCHQLVRRLPAHEAFDSRLSSPAHWQRVEPRLARARVSGLRNGVPAWRHPGSGPPCARTGIDVACIRTQLFSNLQA